MNILDDKYKFYPILKDPLFFILCQASLMLINSFDFKSLEFKYNFKYYFNDIRIFYFRLEYRTELLEI